MKIWIVLLSLLCGINSLAQRLPENNVITGNFEFRNQPIKSNPDCEKYKRMKLSGIILSAGGGGIFAAGAVIAGIGLAGSGGERFGRSSNTGPLLIGGLSCLAVGAACIFAGLPLADIGRRKYKRCQSQSVILLTNGSNLALSF